jgi:hypothetical protein
LYSLGVNAVPKFKPRSYETTRENRVSQFVAEASPNSPEARWAWFNFLEQTLRFPFAAQCRFDWDINHFRQGDIVLVIGLARQEPGFSHVFVRVMDGQKSIPVPLFQVAPLKADTSTMQAVEDWHYWVERGYLS